MVIMGGNGLIDKGVNHYLAVSHFSWVLKDRNVLSKAKACKVKRAIIKSIKGHKNVGGQQVIPHHWTRV